jgi:uncharacterized protein
MNKYKNYVLNVLLAILLLVLIPFNIVSAETEFPKPTKLKYVNDYIEGIDSNSKEYIVSVGKELEDKTGAQAVVVVIDSFGGYDERDYGNKLFRAWGIGQKEENNGLLIIAAIKDRRWTVEVGRGLEGALPDILTKRIMEDVAKPEFIKGNYGEGLRKAYAVFADNIAEEYNVSLEKNEKIDYSYGGTEKEKSDTIPVLIVLGLVFLDLIFNRGRIIRFLFKVFFWSSFFRGGRGGGSGDGGGFGGFGGGDSGGGGSSGGW